MSDKKPEDAPADAAVEDQAAPDAAKDAAPEAAAEEAAAKDAAGGGDGADGGADGAPTADAADDAKAEEKKEEKEEEKKEEKEEEEKPAEEKPAEEEKPAGEAKEAGGEAAAADRTGGDPDDVEEERLYNSGNNAPPSGDLEEDEEEEEEGMEDEGRYIDERERRIRNQLKEIDTQAAKLHREGKHAEALTYQEQSLILRRRFYGIGSDEMEQNCDDLVGDYNTVAMKLLNQENKPSEARKLLEKAERLTEPNGPFVNQHSRLRLRAITYNNIGCLFKHLGKFHLALQNLKKAHTLEQKTPAATNRAGTHLNLCAVLSQLGKHEQALKHAITALEWLGNPNKPSATSGKSEVGIVAIAYHNLAVELEFLRDWDSALSAYVRSFEVAKEELGDEHAMTKQIGQRLKDAEAKSGRKAPGQDAGDDGDDDE